MIHVKILSVFVSFFFLYRKSSNNTIFCSLRRCCHWLQIQPTIRLIVAIYILPERQRERLNIKWHFHYILLSIKIQCASNGKSCCLFSLYLIQCLYTFLSFDHWADGIWKTVRHINSQTWRIKKRASVLFLYHFLPFTFIPHIVLL